MAVTRQVTHQTNMLADFTRRWLGDDSDANRALIIKWNLDYFQTPRGRTMFLPVGEHLWISEPPTTGFFRLTFNADLYTFGGQYISFPAPNI